jgi:aspartyl-tRNA(Asn)/glutamyl-tRNA(Gln) amidotransferase subunit A
MSGCSDAPVVVTLPDTTIAEAARGIASGRLTPLDLTEACLRRIDEIDEQLKAFVTVDSAGALRRARSLTDEPPRSPLHGIPIAIKDIIDVAGLPTTAGSRVLEGNIAQLDAPVVSALREAGAVIVGKTNTHEFAYGVVTPPTLNPWDRSRIPGGSSGGSAAAVAAGMALGALGTDTAGSIRIPAAMCGVSGLKPRPGIVPVERIIPLAPTLDVCGPLARTAVDLHLMWGSLATTSTPLNADVAGVRIGTTHSLFADGELDEEVGAAVDAAVAVLGDAGAHRVEVEVPALREWDLPRSIPLMAEALQVHRENGWYPDRAGEYTQETVAAFRYSETVEPAKLAECYRVLEGLTTRLLSAFEAIDVLVLPTTPVTAPSVHESKMADDGHRPPITRTLTRICGPINCCRLAAVSVPCGMSTRTLPIGMQVVARDEAIALNVAAAYQARTDFHIRRPPL